MSSALFSARYSVFSLFCITISSLLIASCGNRNDVKVLHTNFEEEVAQQQNLVFQFNKDIYPDSLLNNWDSTAYIEFEPAVAGSFRWNSSSELVFSPQTGFRPGSTYKATLSTHLLDKVKHKKYTLDRKRTLTFHTAPLRVASSHTQWTRSATSGVVAQLDLIFNYDADLNQAVSKLKLDINGQEVSFRSVNGGTGKKLSIQFVPVSDKDESADVKVTLAKGVVIAGSTIASKNDTTFTTPIASRYTLAVTNTEAQHDGLQGIVSMSLSQPVEEEGLHELIHIDPSVDFEVKTNDAGLTITSEHFDPKVSYNITLSKAITGLYGGRLKEDAVTMATFAALEPAIRFVNNKGMYLSTKGYRNLALQIVQVPEVEVTVVKVYENNMMQLFRRGSSWGYDYDDEDYHDYRYYNTDDIGDTIYQKKYITDKLPKNNAAHLLHLDFADRLKGYDGVYIITVASSSQKWLQESRILSLSDIGLIVKEEQDKLYVFANSIRHASPISNAAITVISTTNQIVHTMQTDKNGVAVFDQIKEKAPGFHVGMVTAKSGDDYSFITFNESRIETSRFDIGGRNVNATGLNAWIYAERNLYRPGETIHTSMVVRNESWMPPGEMPVKLKLLMPNGKEFATRKKILNEQGSTETEFTIPQTALTGTYVLQAFSGNDVLLSTYNFSIEDFMPDRIKADTRLDKTTYAAGETVNTTLKADNLFGTPAANRKYEWELNLDKIAFQPKGFESYNFEIVKDFYYSTVFRTGVTDAQGMAHEAIALDSKLTATGLLRGNIHTTVFDETGRPVHRYANFEVYTQPAFIGIQSVDDYVGTRKPLRIGLVAVNQQGALQNQSATVIVIRKEWQNVIQQNGNRYQYVSKWIEKEVSRQDMNISGSNTYFSFTPDLSGEYEIRVARAGSDAYVAASFYAYGYGDTQYASFEVNNEGNVTIKSDRESYAPGDAVNLLLTTPFEGRMLVSVERDKVMEYYFVNTENKSASLKLKATDAYLPNVYISATLFRPMDGSNMPLTVAHGYKNIKVESAKNKLPLELSLQEKSRSQTQQTITLKTAPHAYVTIAAVDEGILQVKNYTTPNPYLYFYQKVALAVNSFNIYPLLLPEYRITSSSTGGDGGADALAGRVNPLFVNRVKNVSFWSGILQADAQGHVRYKIDVPQFSGDIRVMAVAYKDQAFGSFDSHVKVADPVVISTALPRFFSPGDQALMPVTLSNTTDKEARAAVSIQTQGAVTISGIKEQTVSIKPHGEARVLFHVAAANDIGSGKVNVSVKSLGETFSNETDIAVRPPASLQKIVHSGTVNAGSSKTLPSEHNFIPESFSGKLIVSNSPLTSFSKNLAYLVHYPYGCVEQTTASAFPQLYYGDLVRTLYGKEDADPNPNYNVQQAILKLQAMQLPNGALSYWPGGDYESWWGSVFAAHFLIEADRAGFEVNDAVLNRLLGYLKFRLKKKEMVAYYYNGNQRKSIAAREVPYSLYVLALARQPQQSLMNFYKGNTAMLSLDSKYLLAAAYAISGQPDMARQVLPPVFSGEQSEHEFGGSFGSYTRDRAIALNALLDINPDNPQVADLARQLSEVLKTSPYINTQETVFSLLALGKIAHRNAATKAEAQIISGGKIIASTQGNPVEIDLKPWSHQPIEIKVSGKGAYYYFREMSGISRDGTVKEEDQYLKVRRSYYTRSGQLISNNTFKQNDLIVVKISIQGAYRSAIENVVITDMLPAGLEIENTRLNDMPNLKWVTDIKDKDEPDYLDVRDDRINIFTEVNANTKNFYYMVRAVSPGIYKLGPVQADAMYNGMYHSYYGSGTVTVTE